MADLSRSAAQELRSVINQSMAAPPAAAAAPPAAAAAPAAVQTDFCTVWPEAKPILQLLSGVVGLIPGAGTGAGVALTALITAGQAVYDQTCGH